LRSWIPAIIGLGLVLRLIHLTRLHALPAFSELTLDPRAYDQWAQQIAAGVWVGRSAFWVDPLYAYFLGALYWLFGHDLFLPRLMNAAFGVATAAVVAATAFRVWGSRAAAIVGAFVVVLFLPAIHYESQLEKTALSVLLVAATVHLFLIGTPRAIAAAGVLAGLGTLARGNGILFVPLGALALALGWDRSPRDPLSVGTGRRARRAALWLGGALPLIALATVHNYLASGELVPTTTNLGINLYLGNNAGNVYGYYQPPIFLQASTDTEQPNFRSEAQRRTGRVLSDRALSDYWAGQSWEAIKAAPGQAALRTLHKLQLVFNNIEVPDSAAIEGTETWSPVFRLPVFRFGQVLCLAVLGIAVGWRRRGVWIVVAVAATYTASLLPFFIMGRLRVQLLPPLAVLAAGGVVCTADIVRRRNWPALGYAAAILAAVALLVFPATQWMKDRQTAGGAIGWYNEGAMLADRGHIDEAVHAFETAVQIDAKAVPAALRRLGSIYQERGDYQRAETAMRQVLEFRPDSASAHDALRKLYDVMLQDRRWHDDAQIRSRRLALDAAAATTPPAAPRPDQASGPADADPVRATFTQAAALKAAGRFDDMIAVLQRAVRQGPYDEGMHYMLGETMEQHATPQAMVEFFSSELSHDPKPQTSQYFWATGLARQGDIDGAIAHLRTALEIDPAHEMSQWRWGLLLERQQPEEALEHLLEATRIHPEFKAALQAAANLAERLGRQAEADDLRRRAAAANPNTIRRFEYWARYLHEHGRDTAALAEINRLLAERANDAEGLRLRDAIRSGATTAATPAGVPATPPPAAPIAVNSAGSAAANGGLSATEHALFVTSLSTQPPGAPVWIVYDARSPSAKALAQDLAAAFESAHWTVRRLAPAAIPLRQGLFFFAADDPPATEAAAVRQALTAAHLQATLGTGYRSFAADRQRSDPAWRGIDFDSDQSFVIAVGRSGEP